MQRKAYFLGLTLLLISMVQNSALAKAGYEYIQFNLPNESSMNLQYLNFHLRCERHDKQHSERTHTISQNPHDPQHILKKKILICPQTHENFSSLKKNNNLSYVLGPHVLTGITARFFDNNGDSHEFKFYNTMTMHGNHSITCEKFNAANGQMYCTEN